MYNLRQWIDATHPYHCRRWLTHITAACGTDSRTRLTVTQSRRHATISCHSLSVNLAGTIHKVKAERHWLSSGLQIRRTLWSKYAVASGRWERLMVMFQMSSQWSCITVAFITTDVLTLIRLLAGVCHYMTISTQTSTIGLWTTVDTIVYSLLTFHIDYCNFHTQDNDKLHRVINVAAHIVANMLKFDHSLTYARCHDLHWPNISDCTTIFHRIFTWKILTIGQYRWWYGSWLCCITVYM